MKAREYPFVAVPIHHGPREARVVALTFDDGPTEFTAGCARPWARPARGRPSTSSGTASPAPKSMLRGLLEDGHEIGCHAWAHVRLEGRPGRAAVSLWRARRAIERACDGRAPVVFRAPYGSVSPGVVRAARALGMTTIGWDVDPRDWERPGVEAIVSEVLGAARGGSIVSLHDGRGDRAQTVEAVPRIVAGLRERGLECVPVSELLQAAD